MSKYVMLSTWIQSETEKSIALEVATGRNSGNSYDLVWFPKSKVIITHPENFADPKRMIIKIPEWLVKSNCNLSPYNYGRLNGYEGVVSN
jgi:hypothetical protein